MLAAGPHAGSACASLMSPRSRQTDVAVIGAGAAGLYTALRRAEAGSRVALISRVIHASSNLAMTGRTVRGITGRP